MIINCSGSRELSADSQEAKAPLFKIGNHAIFEKDHTNRMQGTEAKIVGAYENNLLYCHVYSDHWW